MAAGPKIYESNFPASLDELPKIFLWIRSSCLGANLPASEMRKIELALEEVLVNIILHAYPASDKPSEEKEIQVVCEVYPEEKLQFIVKDRGIAFNPLVERPVVDPLQGLEEREVGGLGIFLTSNLMDEIHYERLEPFNVLLLTKRL